MKWKTTLAVILTALFISVPMKAEEPKAPAVEALGAVLMDFDTGRVLWEKDAKKPLADTAKAAEKVMEKITGR